MDKFIEFFETKGVIAAQFVALLIIGLIIIQLINKTAKKVALKISLERSLALFFVSLINAVLYFALIIMLFSLLGLSTASFVAVFSALALALSLALKDILSNVANGVILAFSKPFKAGDWIAIGDISGVVKKIGIFYTRIVAFDNRVITLPNTEVMSSRIVNHSSRSTRRSELRISVSYGNDIEKIKTIIREAIEAHPKAHKIPEPLVRLEALNQSSIEFLLRVWSDTKDMWSVHYELLENIYKSLLDNKIKVPYNLLDVHIKKEDAEQ